ncbi:bifunctional demethylmenaquinone methyltransferase/2-methoxy-6-polyprenyl-1,4-benzoquinol methylase UbiE [Parapedobacter tibetensis]|uniref:bifunctional demethylmenaquinone methyltransferase/2-methoxy-6-polyprenyl-1,4-benzoquinol methylase UbiE n=1 Tax=Parapedobacter tibetensis TaxID=2972951 RepID=UPI00214DC530|nr:bifunctional demethylmenaquinone methyltransferase/2-methoxy-6-polyprenyl-1,4-benzoquinol methylase UbiE [Parapedobacter tibetensis]
MNAQTTPRASSESSHEQIEKMFDSVSDHYDSMNRIITWGLDRKWRNNVLKLIIERKPNSVLDIATGTGEMAILLSKTGAEHILAVDISQGMLALANEKIQLLNLRKQVKTEIQNAENLSVPDSSFDVVTVVYGIRNFENLEKGLSQILRVLKPGGVMIILETSIPDNRILEFGYLFYARQIMPLIASLFSKDKSAYTYLCKSAIRFPYGREFVKILEEAGFKDVKSMPQTYGISTIYHAKKEICRK